MYLTNLFIYFIYLFDNYISYMHLQLQAYSISTTENDRDYVLHCEEKFEVESRYDSFLSASEVFIFIGGIFLFGFLGFQLYLKAGDRAEGNDQAGKCGNEEEARNRGSSPEEQTGTTTRAQKTSVSGSHTSSESEANWIQKHKMHVSLLLMINFSAIVLVSIDITTLSQQADVLSDAFSYGFAIIHLTFFAAASLSILAMIVLIIVFVIIFCKNLYKSGLKWNYKKILLYLLISVMISTATSFFYLIVRIFVILLAFATYPLDIGFALLGIGSGAIGSLFVIWVIFHIIAVSRKNKLEWRDIFLSLVPYAALWLLLLGFLLSYIFVIMRVSIQPVDPVTSFVSTFLSVTIAYVVGKYYDRQLKTIDDQNKKDKGTQTGITEGGHRPGPEQSREASVKLEVLNQASSPSQKMDHQPLTEESHE